MTVFGENMWREMQKQGINRHQMSVKAGIAYPTICKLVDKNREVYPTILSAELIADVLGVSLDYLCGRDKNDISRSN